MLRRILLIPVLLSLLCVLVMGISPVQAQSETIYIIGIIEPLNKTENPGHIDFPYYGEEMENILTSNVNNYIVRHITEEDLAAVGYRFSSLRPDTDIQPAQYQQLCKNLKLDAVLTGKIYTLKGNLEPRFLAEAGRFIEMRFEGLLYDREGRKVWSEEVSDKYEFTREKGEFKPPFNAQLVNFYVSKIDLLAKGLIDRIGTRITDKEPPTIELENIRSGDKVTSTCIILKGTIADNSRVASVRVNGQELNIDRPQKQIQLFHPVQIPQGQKGQRLQISVEARDIYGISQTKELDLTWETPVKGIVTSINPDTLSVYFGYDDFKRIKDGSGFIVYSVDEFVDPLSSRRFRMFHVEEIGPVVVIKRFPDKQVVQVKFLNDNQNSIGRAKKDDIVK